jgi:hypothetical protein
MVQPRPDRPFLGDNGWKYDVFLLHAGQNKKFVENLYRELCSRDVLPFFDKYSLPIGTKAQDLIMEALQTTSRFIVPVLSHEIKGKSYPENEMKKAVDRFERFKESGVQSPPVLIVPVFYLTTPDECHESTNQFVKDMSAFTGIVRQEDDEDAYLRTVAEEITKMVKRDDIKFQDVVEALENMTAKGSSCQPQPLGPEPDQGGVTVQQKEKSPYEIMKNLVVDNGKKTSGSTSTESVEQPGRGGGANGLQEKTDHGGRGHPGMLEQSTAVIVVVSFTPALIKWLTSSARPAPTRGPTDPDNGKKTSGSTSTESVEQPGRGGGANGLQEKTDHGGRGHPGMLEQSTAVDGGAQDTNLPLSDLHKRAEEKATQEELRDVAKEVQAVWPDFATHLDSYMFTAARISVIRRNSGLYPSEFICAKFMLEKWAQNQDRKATRRRLIKAMYDNDLIAEARKVFETTHKYHGLVEYVLKSTGGK